MAKELDRFEENPKKNISLKTKLISIITGAVFLGTVVTSVVALEVFDRGLVSDTQEQLGHTSSGAMYLLDDWRDNIYRYANILSTGSDVIRVIAGDETISAVAVATDKQAKFGLDLLVFVDNAGTVINGIGAKAGYKSSSSVINTALRGTESYTYGEFGDMEFGLFAAAPVRGGINNSIIGCIVAGYDLTGDSDDSYVTIINTNYAVECTVFKDKTRVATTLGRNMIGTTLANEAIVKQVLQGGTEYDGHNVINGEDYYANYIPLSGTDGKVTGMLFIAKSMKVIEHIKTRTLRIVIPIGVALIIALAVVAFLFVNWMMNRINAVTVFLGDLASGDADLTKRCALYLRDEIGQLIINFDLFMDKLHEIVKTLKESKMALGDSGDNLSASTEDTASSITEIIANIDSIHNQINSQNQSVGNTNDSVQHISSAITDLDRLIEGQSASVTQASAAVEQMIGNISSVNKSVEKMSTSFRSLEENAEVGFTKQENVNERIKQIENQSQMLQEANSAISSIASQTNLLAMNAAIEAAHAGEAGKGFAVVADEIRKLSETSSAQSKKIGEQLNGIRASIADVVNSSSEASEALTGVSSKIKETDQLVIQIRSAMEEQNEGSKQIVEALRNLNGSTVEVKNSSHDMSSRSEQIVSDMTELQEVTNMMNTSMEEMSVGARKINETGAMLSEIAGQVKDCIGQIGAQVDLFKV